MVYVPGNPFCESSAHPISMTPGHPDLLHLTKPGLTPDPAQVLAAAQLEDLQHRLLHSNRERHAFSRKLTNWFQKHQLPVTGIYMWGGVGRGKTWLMDLFFDNLPFKQKLRLHFHHFMQTVHDQLSLLKGQRDPLRLIARNLARHTQVICLDEFHVDDITDAMLLRGLLDALFNEGVTLVATSNQPPDELYKHGLQREQFLPAIALIKTFTEVLRVDGGIDHRLRLLEKADVWHVPLGETTDNKLKTRFAELAPVAEFKPEALFINYREIPAVLCADDLVWFDFNILCSSPRATADYIEIARRFHTVFISNIPQLNEASDDKATRFINLIDEFYDRNIKLVASAATAPDDIYTGKQLAFEFQRTRSRLEEMRSHEYLARAHKSG
jgi:cell division protein ZapE